MPLRAKRAGGDALDYLAASPRVGTVAGRFRHGLILRLGEDDDLRLLAVQGPAASLHPWAIETASRPADVARGTVVHTGDIAMEIGAVHVAFRGVLRCPLAVPTMTLESFAAARSRLTAWVASPHGLAAHAATGDLLERLLGLRERLASASPRALLSLLGRGPGSTPLGDDLIVGALAGASAMREITWPRTVHPQWLGKVLRSAPLYRKTTAASAQMIDAALGGSFPEPLCALLARLTERRSSTTEVNDAACRLAELGGLSGIGFLHGIYAAVCRWGLRTRPDVKRIPARTSPRAPARRSGERRTTRRRRTS
ncbi:MAG: DUF2877 domain-containing protein [Candidatus Bipolaricaulota bacterium]|nr:MAG: DUF2877 domain-containing protein [Candidatus Bipolaricaulota bacterium]